MAKEVHAAHILCGTEKRALEVREKLSAGQGFAEMARRYSQCPSGKSGGDLGWFGKGRMVPEFEKAAFEGERGKALVLPPQCVLLDHCGCRKHWHEKGIPTDINMRQSMEALGLKGEEA